jgi:hypothetical protein
MDRAIAIGKSYCTFQKFVTVLFALCGFSILFWGIKNRNASNKMSVTTSGTLSNVNIVSSFQDKSLVYSMTDTVTFTRKGKEVTQSVTGTKSTYQNDQKVTLVYDPKSGIAIIKDEYTSPAEQAKIAIGVAMCCLITFLFLSTDLGCSMSVIGGIGRLF